MATGTLVTGLFSNATDAERALVSLTSLGINRADISAVASDGKAIGDFGIEKHSRAGEGAAIGAGFGGALGALLAGFTAVGAIATGGAGLIVAGPIVAALAGAGAGAATGGLIGGLIGLGIPEHEVKYYTESFEKGAVLIGVRTTNDDAPRIRATLEEHGATRTTSQNVNLPDAVPAAGRGEASSPRTATRANGAVSASDWARENPLRQLFIDQLRDIYYAEHQLVDSLKKLEDVASTPELAQAFREHRDQTMTHIDRLESVFSAIGVKAEQKKCPAMNGIISEAKELMKLDNTPAERDAAIICAAQKAEHYEIGTYGCLRTYAQTLGMTDVAHTLEQTLREEWEADQKLTDLAEAGINRRATLVAPGA